MLFYQFSITQSQAGERACYQGEQWRRGKGKQGGRGQHNTPCRQAPSFIHSFIHFIHALLTCVVCVVVVVIAAVVGVVAPSCCCCCCCFCHSLVETSVFLPRVQKGFLFFLFFVSAFGPQFLFSFSFLFFGILSSPLFFFGSPGLPFVVVLVVVVVAAATCALLLPPLGPFWLTKLA